MKKLVKLRGKSLNAFTFKIRFVANIIQHGGIVAYPTETVYGLGCDPLNEPVVRRLLHIKRRSVEKGLILIASHIEQVIPYVCVETAQLQCIFDQPSNYPTTWLFPMATDVPVWLSGEHSTIAIRITCHPIANLLCQAVGSPLVSTSANISNRKPARSALQVMKIFSGQLDGILSGVTRGQCSEIKDWASGDILRPFPTLKT